jgi:hypothetical protein
MGDGDSDKRCGDRQNPQHHAAMRSVDPLHPQRHQKRKQDGDAYHGDHELRPQRAGRQLAAQHKEQRKRTQPGDRGAQRGQSNRINFRNRDPRRRQRAAEDRHADEAQQQAETLARSRGGHDAIG